jgi:hypothetical protein
MQRGDTVYLVNGIGVLEEAIFQEESLAAPTCTERTWVLRDHGQMFRCNSTMYVESKIHAWERYLQEMNALVPFAEQGVTQAQEHLAKVRAEVARVQQVLVHIQSYL